MSKDRFEDNLKFLRNGKLLCGAWLLKSFEQREGQRVLSCSRNRVEALGVERLGSPALEGKILQLTLLNFTEFAVTILYQVRNLV